jgi:hypothetical protein
MAPKKTDARFLDDLRSIPAYVKKGQKPIGEIRRTEEAVDLLDLASRSTEGQAFRAADDEPDWK